MEFKEILNKNIEKNKIALGTKVGDLLDLDINTYNSIIITGETGSGKSIMLDQIILQMIAKYTSDELRLLLIDTTGVELNYYKDTNYSLLTAMNDIDKAQEVLAKILEEISRRRQILLDNNVLSIDEFNKQFNHNIPKLLIAIDDNKGLLKEEDVDKMLKKIIGNIDGLNILFTLSTNDVFNKFFEKDENLLSKVLISFDTTNHSESQRNNIPFSSELKTGKFIVYRDNNYEEYQNFDFDENIIKEILD